MSKEKRKILFCLLVIFLLGLTVRFCWFPKNVYFGYDQARDAIVSQEIYSKGDLKIVGPSAGKEGLSHGPAYWYLIGPVYLLFGGNPTFVLAFISVLNALGVFLIYYLAKNLFDERIGLIASFLYTTSFSQTQYSLYFANPAPAVLSIISFYLGWALLIFRKKNWAWVLVGAGLGFSIQFEFFLIYLFSSIFLFLLFFWKDIGGGFRLKSFFLGLFTLFLTLSSFVIVEFKYGFKIIKMLLGLFLLVPAEANQIRLATSNFLGRLGMEVYYDVFRGVPKTREILAIGFFLLVLFLIIKLKDYRKQFIFILVWIFSNKFLDFFGPPQLYYVGIGLSIPIILVFAFSFEKMLGKQKLFAIIFLAIFMYCNFHLIRKYNPSGPVMDLYVQKGMLLEDEKKVLDYIYLKANNEKFIVNALTMPYKIKTTWAYLFNWYGKQKYGYVPFWGGEDVPGYAGKLPLPGSDKYMRFAIFEPMRGIPEHLKKEFIDSENGFATPSWKEKIGYFEVEKRIPNR